MQSSGNKKVVGSRKEEKATSTTVGATSAPSALQKAGLLAYPNFQQDFVADLTASDEEVSDVESLSSDQVDAEFVETASKVLFGETDGHPDLRAVDPQTLEALLEAAGIGNLSKLNPFNPKAFSDTDTISKLTSMTSMSSALEEAEAELYRIRAEAAATSIANPMSAGGQVPMVSTSQPDTMVAGRLVDDGKVLQDSSEESESLLSLACSGGYYELAQVLLKINANVEDRGSKRDCTPLMEAASAGHKEIVQLLLDHMADVNAQSSAGNTPLMYACSSGQVEIVKLLLDHGANIEDHNENGHTPLMEAASSGYVEIAKILLERGAGINTHSTEFKESALTLACYKGHLEMVKFLLEHGADHEHKTDEMHTALMEASMDGHVEVARLLLDHGAQVNMPADSFESPLTLAACGGHTKLASLLLERGANIEEVNDEGYTPLMEAAREGHEEMVALLLAQGADINAQTEETQETALTLACCGGFLEVARFLIDVGADIELGCSTPLMEAAQEGHGELVQFLLSKSANVHATTATGDTALTYACENGHTDVANYLLAAGANLEHESEGGRTPLMKAARAGHLCTVRYLIRRGADVNRATASNDHTVLSLACAGGHLSVVELLLAHGADPSHKLKDNSTCLIEAAKGGHSGVMALVLGYPRNLQTPVEGTTTPPTPEQGEIPRVPTQALPTVVPPQEPDRHPDEALSVAEMLEDAGDPMDPAVQEDPLYQQKLDSDLSAAQLVSSFPSSLIERTSNSIGRPAIKHIKTAEEQILEKQQIIAELQKVERELQQRMEIQKAQSEILAKKKAELASKSLQDGVDDITSVIEAAAPAAPVLDISEANNNHQDSPESPTCPVREETVSDLSLDMREIKLNRPSPPIPEEFELPQFVEKQKVEESSQTGGRDMVTNNTQTSEAYINQTFTSIAERQSKAQDRLLPESISELQTKDKRVATTPLPEVHTFLNNIDPSQLPSSGISKEERPVTEGQEQPDSTPPQDIQLDGLSFADQREAMKMMGHMPSKFEHLVKPIDLPSLTEEDLNAWTDTQTPEQKRSIPQTQSVGTQCGGLDRLPLNPTVSPSPYPSAPTSPGEFDPSAFNPHPPVEIDAQTESNHDTALTIACAGGYDELVQMLLDKKANIEHRDKKGFTPLILAATAGHYKTVKILLQHDADIEAQSERTKDTPLSLACSGGRYEVVELLLKHGANKEHRNVSDYTPLSLAASGGYVNIIKLLLKSGAEINSRTGSKLGISPLMLAAMNGHTAAVKLLLDNGSDINAQIETNRNTALTLACFQGRTEVVSLLVDRKANVEHRAKTGLTPLMEAASGGYAEVGAVLISKGADVNAPPVPSSRDTALTIAADKGHYKFVELLLQHGAAVDVKNKKGQSSLWLACNGGHLDVVQLLVREHADIDSQDNRKVSCLMAAFRKFHVKVVRWMVKKVNQFPSDTECIRYIATVSDKELRKKCNSCLEIIVIAKNRQAAEAAKNASILLEELESEKTREESRKAAAAKRREKKRKKRKEKQAKTTVSPETILDGEDDVEEDSPPSSMAESLEEQVPLEPPSATTTTTIGIVRTTDTIRLTQSGAKKTKRSIVVTSSSTITTSSVTSRVAPIIIDIKPSGNLHNGLPEDIEEERRNEKREKLRERKAESRQKGNKKEPNENRNEDSARSKAKKKKLTKDGKQTNHSIRDDYHGVTPIWSESKKSPSPGSDTTASTNLKNTPLIAASPKRGQRRDEGWKEVVRRSKKVTIPAASVSRVIGRGGNNINAIRDMTGAHIDVERQNKGGERSINIKGSAEATRQAHQLITALIKEPDKEIVELVARLKKSTSTASQSPSQAVFTQGVNGSLAQPQSSNKAASSGSGNNPPPRMNPKNPSNTQQPSQNMISKPPPSQATISQFLPRNFPAMSNSQPRLSSGSGGTSHLQNQLPPRLAGGNLRWGAPQITRPTHPAPSIIPRTDITSSPTAGSLLMTSQSAPVKSDNVQSYQQPMPSQEKPTQSSVTRRLFSQPPAPVQSSAAPVGSPLKQMISPPIVTSTQMIEQTYPNSHGSSLFGSATITVTTTMERLDRQSNMSNMSGLVFTSAPIGTPKHVMTDSNQSFAPIPNPQIGMTANSRPTSALNLLNQLSQSVGPDMWNLTNQPHGLENNSEHAQVASATLQSEEAKAPGYKRLSNPVGSVPQVQQMTNSALSRPQNYSGQGPIFNPVQGQYFSNPIHAMPPGDRASINPSPFGHAPPPDITNYSPAPTPESHTPTPPPNGSPVSPGTSPRSGSTSPSSQERRMPMPIGTGRHHKKQPGGYPGMAHVELMGGALSGGGGASIWSFQGNGNNVGAGWSGSTGLEDRTKPGPHMAGGMPASLTVSEHPMFANYINMVPGLNPYNPNEMQEPMHGGLPPPHQMAYQPGAMSLPPLDSRLWNPPAGNGDPPREWVWSQQTM